MKVKWVLIPGYNYRGYLNTPNGVVVNVNDASGNSMAFIPDYNIEDGEFVPAPSTSCKITTSPQVLGQV